MANTCTYSVSKETLGNRPLHDVFLAALARVVLALPSLTVCIAGEETSKPSFTSPASLNLDHHLEFSALSGRDTDSELLAVLADKHDQLWQDIKTRPPWKVTVNGPREDGERLHFEVMFSVHHSLCDGRGSQDFHRALLNELSCSGPAAPLPQLSGHVLELRRSVQLIQPQEELVNFRISWWFLIRTLWNEFAPAWLQGTRPLDPWAGKPITLQPCRTRLRLVTVSATAVPRLLAACRQNKTTLTPLLHILTLWSLARNLPSEVAQSFCSLTPVDLRPFVDRSNLVTESSSSMGVFVTAQSHNFEPATVAALREQVEGDEMWKRAAVLRDEMKRRLETTPADDIMGLLSWIDDWQKYWLAKIGHARSSTFEVSNIGPMEGRNAAGGSWQIQRQMMSQSAMVAGPAIALSVSGVQGGPVCIVLSWQDGVVETEVVEGLAADLQRWLDELGQHGRFTSF